MRAATASRRWSPLAAALLAAELAELRARDAPAEARLVAPEDALDAFDAARLVAPEDRAEVERLLADDPPELFFAVVDRLVVRFVPEERLARPLDPEPELDDPLDDDPALLLGWGMVFSSFVDRGGPTAP